MQKNPQDNLQHVPQSTPEFQPPPQQQENNAIEIQNVDKKFLFLVSKSIFWADNVIHAPNSLERAHAILTNIEVRSTELDECFPHDMQEGLNHALGEIVEMVREGANPEAFRLSLSEDGKSITVEQNAPSGKEEDLLSQLPAIKFQRIHGSDEQVGENVKFLRKIQERGMKFMRSQGYSEEQALEANKYATENYNRSWYATRTVSPNSDSGYRQEVWERYGLGIKEYASANSPKAGEGEVQDVQRSVNEVELARGRGERRERGIKGVGTPAEVQERAEGSVIKKDNDGNYVVSEDALNRVVESLKPDVERINKKVQLLGEKQKCLILLDESGSVEEYKELIPQIAKSFSNAGLEGEIEIHKFEGTGGGEGRNDYDNYRPTIAGKAFGKNIIFAVTDATEEGLTQRELVGFLDKNPGTQFNFIHTDIIDIKKNQQTSRGMRHGFAASCKKRLCQAPRDNKTGAQGPGPCANRVAGEGRAELC